MSFLEFPKSAIEQTIQRRFEAQVAAHAHHVAVKTPTVSWTYAVLNRVANGIAMAILDQIGDRPGQVGLMLPSGPHMIGALLGVLKAGKAYVPLDPNFPRQRLSFMVENAELELILSDQNSIMQAAELSGTSLPLLDLDHIAADAPASRAPLPDPAIDVAPDSMAYILYTSGSTGHPKGIAFGHRNLLHTIMCLTNQLRYGSRDRLTQLHSTSFAAAVVDIYCSLLNGGTVYPWDVKRNGFVGLADWLISEQVTSLQWIPTPFRHLLETFDGSERFPNMRLIVMASEPLTVREVGLVRQHFEPSCRLVNQMGTSESYNYRLFFVDGDTKLEENAVPVGYAVSPEREVMILDDQKRELAHGKVGEIAVRSPYMSLGYWRNPELNQSKFLVDPSNQDNRIFLTGDMGYLKPDGCLVHLGRKDFQVKIRGHRIEMGEIERRLGELPQIGEAVVHVRQRQDGEQELVAYVVAASGTTTTLAHLRDHLAKHLPDHMLPARFCQIESLPLTDTGKLDRNALSSLDSQLGRDAGRLTGQMTELEKVVAAICHDILRLKRISNNDNLFEVGANSLTMAQLLQRINRQFDRQLPFSALIQTPTISGIAEWLDGGAEAQRVAESKAGLADTDTPIPDGLWQGILNRVCQILALYAPGRKSTRVWLHRQRGVSIGQNVAIGTAAIIETSYPRLVSIGNNSSLGIRTVIIGHFVDGLGATPVVKNSDRQTDVMAGKSVIIEDDVFVGPMVTILPNVTIGRGAVVAAGSVVNQSVPSRVMVQGNPAKPIARCPIPLNGKTTYEEFLSGLEFFEGQ